MLTPIPTASLPLTLESIKQTATALNIPWSESLATAVFAQSLLAPIPMTPQMPSPIDLENTESLVSQWEFLVPRSDGFLEDGLQGYIQAVRSLKWHEAPMPSLFIILPHYSTQESKPNYDDLLLFWMCEHMDDRAIAPHLDFHPEVYIKRPTEFLDRYGNHVLWSLQIFQQYRVHKLHETVTSKGFTNGNLGIDYDQTIAFLQKRLSISQERIESSIDMMAQHIQERSSAGSTVKQFWEGKNLSRFAAEDLVHLQSFLHLPGMNEARAAEGLSNLRRSVDADGNVHWVCSAHFRKIYPFSIFGQTYLRNIEGPLAIYNANKGQLVVKPSSGVKAREIYGIMQSSPGFVSELCLHIGWKITAEDIAFMYNAVVDSNLSSLSLTGPGDSLASAIRSECILKMLACPRIQSFWLENAGGFLENIVPRVVTGRFFGLRSLRFTLHTTGRATIQDQFWTQILWIVACSPNLKALDISWDEMEKTISVSEILQELSRLPFQSLAIRLKSLKQAESVTIDHGTIAIVKLEVADIRTAVANPVFSQGIVHNLTIVDQIDSKSEDLLKNILLAMSSLESLNLTIRASDFMQTEQMVRSTISHSQQLHSLQTSYNTEFGEESVASFRQLFLTGDGEESIKSEFSFNSNDNQSPENDRDITAVSTYGDVKFIDITVVHGDPEFESVLVKYGAYIRTLNMAHPFALHHLAILNNAIIRQQKSRLESLLIALDCGRWRGDQNLRQIFESCSKTLKQLTLIGCIEDPQSRVLFLKTLVFYKGLRVVVLRSRLHNERDKPIDSSAASRQPSADSENDRSGNAGKWSEDEEAAMVQWIEKVREAISKDTTLVVSEDFDALQGIVPGLSQKNIDWLRRYRTPAPP